MAQLLPSERHEHNHELVSQRSLECPQRNKGHKRVPTNSFLLGRQAGLTLKGGASRHTPGSLPFTPLPSQTNLEPAFGGSRIRCLNPRHS